MSRRFGRASAASIIFTLIVVAVSAWLILNRQTVRDFAYTLDYQPSARISEIKDNLQLTPSGDFLFKASRPEINPASSFNSNCGQNKETNNPIVGCYYKDKIYVFDVDNQELSGIEETTAAHELLHAVYQRMPDAERQALDEELDVAYGQHKTKELANRMAYYEKTEPGERYNELHSILGTEIGNLTPSLEGHYARYFSDRQVVVNYYAKYSGVFEQIRLELTNLQAKINRETKQIEARIDQWKRDRQAFIDKNNARGFKTVVEFNAVQDGLNYRLDLIQNDIDTSNLDRKAYNKLVDRYNQLHMDLNSSIAPAPKTPAAP